MLVRPLPVYALPYYHLTLNLSSVILKLYLVNGHHNYGRTKRRALISKLFSCLPLPIYFNRVYIILENYSSFFDLSFPAGRHFRAYSAEGANKYTCNLACTDKFDINYECIELVLVNVYPFATGILVPLFLVYTRNKLALSTAPADVDQETLRCFRTHSMRETKKKRKKLGARQSPLCRRQGAVAFYPANLH